MRLNRFFGDFDFQQKSLRISDRDFLHQIKNVLWLGKGQQIILADGKLNEAVAEILAVSRDDLTVKILTISQNINEPIYRVILYCSILKRENFELVVQKATEVGAAEIAPIICQRTIKTGLKKDRLEKIIKQAAEQSSRGSLPVLREVTDFKEAIADTKENNINILFDSSGAKFVQSDCTNLAPQEKPRVGIFIGPEGGWSEEEITAAKEAGFKIVSLGKLTLRAETAAIIASYIICSF